MGYTSGHFVLRRQQMCRRSATRCALRVCLRTSQCVSERTFGIIVPQADCTHETNHC